MLEACLILNEFEFPLLLLKRKRSERCKKHIGVICIKSKSDILDVNMVYKCLEGEHFGRIFLNFQIILYNYRT